MIIQLPLYVELGKIKIKRHYINVNSYRNWHHRVSNNIKIEYKRQVSPQLKGLNFERVSLRYVYYKPTARKVDLGNVLSITDKFFSDALVENGCLADDNCYYIPEITFKYGGIDRDNPRVEVTINGL